MAHAEIREFIIRKLIRQGYMGGSKPHHTPLENVPKGLPRHLWGEAKEEAKLMLKECIFLPYQTKHGLDVYLNPFHEEVRKHLYWP